MIRSSIICKQLIERDFLKSVHAQNLQYPAQAFVDSMDLIETGHHEVNADCDPDPGSHGVLFGSKESFDAKVLHNPLEEEFNLPAAPVDGCHGQSGTGDVPTNAHCLEMSGATQTSFDVLQALAKSDLRDSHRENLVAGSHAFTRPGHWVQCHTTIELLTMDEIRDLSGDQASSVYAILRMSPAEDLLNDHFHHNNYIAPKAHLIPPFSKP